MKTCRVCGETKPYTDFYSSPKGIGGVKATCKTCTKAAISAYRQLPGFVERRREYAAEWRAANPDRIRANTLRRNHGMTPDELSQMGSSCLICGSTDRLCVDHDHACCGPNRSCSGCRRGLLCSECNTGLGKFRERPDLMLAAIEYLASFRLP